jgi:hypothetical protein
MCSIRALQPSRVLQGSTPSVPREEVLKLRLLHCNSYVAWHTLAGHVTQHGNCTCVLNQACTSSMSSFQRHECLHTPDEHLCGPPAKQSLPSIACGMVLFSIVRLNFCYWFCAFRLRKHLKDMMMMMLRQMRHGRQERYARDQGGGLVEILPKYRIGHRTPRPTVSGPRYH